MHAGILGISHQAFDTLKEGGAKTLEEVREGGCWFSDSLLVEKAIVCCQAYIHTDGCVYLHEVGLSPVFATFFGSLN